MITLTRVKGLSHKNVAAKGLVFPARMDRLSNSRAPDLFCSQNKPDRFAMAFRRNAKLLNKKEKKLSKFFKCCSDEWLNSTVKKKCYWSGNDVQMFRQHLQKCHQKFICIYCRFDAISGHSDDERIQSFETTDCEEFITHLIQSHGKRKFQCNRCQYRAITSTHIQFHEILKHFDIWYSFDP